MQYGWAVRNRELGHVNVVQCLVEAGANLKAEDRVSVHLVWEYVDVWHGH
jgi:hypothetical protein